MEVNEQNDYFFFVHHSLHSFSIGPWRQVQSAVKKIHDMHQLLKRDADTEPIIIAYNDKVSLSNLASVAQMRADGSTNFVSGKLR